LDVEKVVRYWLTTAADDLIAAEHLFQSGDYTHALFFAHLYLVQFHRINLNMLLWPWADSPQVVGDRLKNVSRQAICAASGGD